MATVILDLSGTLPQTFTTGNWPQSAMNSAKYHFVWTPTAANSDAAWGASFYAMLASSGSPSGSDNGGLYINTDALELYNQTGLLVSIALTWSAGAAIDITVDMAGGSITISGATTGNGSHSFTPSGTVYTSGTLGVGVYGGGGFNLPSSTLGDIDDAATGVTLAADAGSFTLTGTAAGLKVAHRLVAEAGTFTLAGTAATLSVQSPLTLKGLWSISLIPALWWGRELSPPAWFTLEAAAAPPAPGAYTLAAGAGSFTMTGSTAGLKASRLLTAGAGSYALTGTAATLSRVTALTAASGSYALTGADVGFRRALRLVAGAGSFTLTGTDAALTYSGASTLAIGDHGVDAQTYGSASRDAAVTLDTQASGSIVIVASGGLTGDVNASYTDNKSNTLVKIGSTTNYTDWGSTYGVALGRVKPPMTGGTSHTFGQTVTLFSESTMFAIEVIGGGRIVGYSWINTSNTGAGSTVTSDPVTAYEPVVWISFWWGAHPVFSPNTTPFQASASGSGFTDLDSFLVNDVSGEVQAASAALLDTSPTVASPVTKTVTWSHYPNQGAQVILIAVAAPARLTADSGSFTMTGTAATLRRTIIMTAAGGSFSLTGSDATLRRATTLAAGAGSFALTGAAAALRVTRKLTAEAGSFTTTGADATLRYVRSLTAASGALTLSGTAAGLVASRKLTAAAGSFTTAGTAANLAVTYRLVAGAGSFTVTGTDAGLKAARKVTAAAGSYAMTGTAANLARTVRLVAAGGSFALTGTAAGMRASRALTAAAGAFTLSGSAAGLRMARRLVAAAGAYELAGTDAALTFQSQATINAEPGAFTLTGTDAALTYARRLVAGPGAFSLTGAAASLLLARRISALAGAYTFTGFAATLTVRSGAEPLPHGLALTRTTAATPALTRTTPDQGTTRTTAATRLTRTT